MMEGVTHESAVTISEPHANATSPTKPVAEGLKTSLSSQFTAPALTGAQAKADEERLKAQQREDQRRQSIPREQRSHESNGGTPSGGSVKSVNPAHAVQSALSGAQDTSISKPSDVTPRSRSPLTVPNGRQNVPTPTITTSLAGNSMHVDEIQNSPLSMTGPEMSERRASHGTLNTDSSHSESVFNKALTYPPRQDQSRSEARHMSLPNSSTRSPSTRRYKCPNCSTEFTRHHNLKSHLLTHSQEKPFKCDVCNSKFRRLHDLKRHSKLHTGERPHKCPRCDRTFARGDALARHIKGAGGCAGKRGSGGEEDFDGSNPDETMDLDDSYDDNNASPNSARRRSEPGKHKRNNSLLDPNIQSTPQRQHSSTYPGSAAVQYREDTSSRRTSAQHLSPRQAGSSYPPPPQSQSSSVFGQSGSMTESPRPLSPGQNEQRRFSAQLASSLPPARSPSLSHTHQLPHQSARLPLPISSHPPHPQQLPSLSGLSNAVDSRVSSYPSPTGSAYPSKSQRPPPLNATNSSYPPPAGPNSASSAGPGSASSAHRSSGGSMREILNPTDAAAAENVRRLESENRYLKEEMAKREEHFRRTYDQLQSEITALKAHAAH